MKTKTVGKKKSLGRAKAPTKTPDYVLHGDQAAARERQFETIKELQAEIMRLKTSQPVQAACASVSTLRATLADVCRCLAEEME